MLVFYFNVEPRLNWNLIILAAKAILFHFKRGSMLKQELIRRWDSERELLRSAPGSY